MHDAPDSEEHFFESFGRPGKKYILANMESQSSDNFTQALQARPGIVSGFISLDLLFFQPKPLGELALAQSRSDASLDESPWKLVE